MGSAPGMAGSPRLPLRRLSPCHNNLSSTPPYTGFVKHPAFLLSLLLAGCVATRPPNLTFLDQARWEVEVRARGVDPAEIANPLLVTEHMREFATRVAGTGTPTERLGSLQRALFDERTFPFSYENRGTFTAAEAFYRRQGNCLSFTNLFVALGRSLGLPVTTALVTQSRGSEREGDLIVVNTHVVAVLSYAGGITVYDFERSRFEQPRALRSLDDIWITALYLNNRGSEELRAGRPDAAIRHFQQAVRLVPTFAGGWGNLGVARRRLGDVDGALAAYAQALAVEPDNPTVLSNLAALYRFLGKEAEAQTALAAANTATASPHVLLVRGDLELAQGHVEQAIRFYRLARSRQPALADTWVALARAELARGRKHAAHRYLEKALKLAPGHRQALALLNPHALP